ncbi:hypothetical protein L873DRAFT_786032 [Choiromyces venosus 120613-1]|uniref:Uncharacterized protein n=1 Tax=Choiromyces venosus 120613-1 TaxID=1336337 RepID=A0A3N4K468_9PEZI|nr:hypothetical protein L873DRAFT_786032 [Choiromyces venosus 120613-1]
MPGVSHEGYRIQTILLMQIMAYTSSRPGALVESSAYNSTNECLTYKDMQLVVIRNTTDDSGDALALIIRTTLLKGGRNIRELVEYILHAISDLPLYCPITFFLALAFADNAFEHEGMTPADLFKLKVRDENSSILIIPWKKSVIDTLVFRRVEQGDSQVSPTLAFHCNNLSNQLNRLGKLAGFTETLHSYCFWRSNVASLLSKEATTDGVTAPVTQQILGHSSPDVIRHYIQVLVNVDIQFLYLGQLSRTELIGVSVHMGRIRDARAPVKLSSEELIVTDNDHPMLPGLHAQKEELKKEIVMKWGTIVNAEGTELWELYRKLSIKISNTIQMVRTERFEQVQKEYFSQYNYSEISD